MWFFAVGELFQQSLIMSFAIKNAMINIMSGSNVTLNYGEGILDFIYADFLTPVKKAYALFHLLEQWGEENIDTEKYDKKEDEGETKLTEDEWVLQTYERFSGTFPLIESIAYSSLYSTIFPPLIKGDLTNSVARYGNSVPKQVKA